ncbi:hypothetical protein [Phycicoccus flavus]|uniref:hypothetical protein n=1 Tax=Phycicoccus flavus TaxID=2502783 RepID=UPI000FEBB252|nr:hypothetical protein [Phycicoccus flavus]NHA68773.1 hypothetical protein [Phycicoccus flavus]
MQTSRRTTPYPWTWEIPAGALTAVLLLLVLAAHTARALANGFTGGGWDYTPRDQLFTALPALLAGDTRAGLPTGPGVSAAAFYAWLAACETGAVAAIVCVTVMGLRQWGPGRVHGMASRTEAQALLGTARLRRVAPVIRPDLYPRRRWPR